MKSKILAIFGALLLTSGSAFATGGPGGCNGCQDDFAFVQVGQDQVQTYDGISFGTPMGGLTIHGGMQAQENSGIAFNGNGAAYQSEEQGHEYGGSAYSPFAFSEQTGSSLMTADNFGTVNNCGSFTSNAEQLYDAKIENFNTINFTASGIKEGFGQNISGFATPGAEVGNSLGLNSYNSYSSGSYFGNDYVYNDGMAYTNSYLNGEVANRGMGMYEGSISGFQEGNTMTAQDGNGTFQMAGQTAIAELSLDACAMGRAHIEGGADMFQGYGYEQYNQGKNGFQYQTGSVSTQVEVSTHIH
ncbi:hypothetical protein C0583_06665 [Candidatus Parcubacteria bacterium]|nr:MAG: hypothetical protein C0583_06665 [Candidatus Parcubacteria bacterium]